MSLSGAIPSPPGRAPMEAALGDPALADLQRPLPTAAIPSLKGNVLLSLSNRVSPDAPSTAPQRLRWARAGPARPPAPLGQPLPPARPRYPRAAAAPALRVQMGPRRRSPRSQRSIPARRRRSRAARRAPPTLRAGGHRSRGTARSRFTNGEEPEGWRALPPPRHQGMEPLHLRPRGLLGVVVSLAGVARRPGWGR